MRPEKKSIVDEMRAEAKDAGFVILTDYRGLSVAQTENLRTQLARVDARFRVIHNRMFKKFTGELSLDGFDSALKGPSAVVTGRGDVAETARVLKDFMRANKMPSVKMAAVEGQLLKADEVDELAELPAKPVMQAILLGTLAAPMTRLAGVLSQKVASVLYVLKAVEEKKQTSL
ncbi:MAG TPA: 50S ribosomal protein L10 [Kiritimatiellia bacterium]|nr:50S ribosomal protein L10 [Kiritimatiellia bacterium]HNR94583.1 50S ribosomal protein L10 [Kiritimatiellia bacterium]HNS81297.1 50S ribosomal protein L10 [Kiritimatiellia bacterium]HPA77619.1 50S ribosomal protein L10 [Kiritimatiellia bacterium]HQQ04816.1 50S ribosomal protein L10 [Kiritimatiellia bacterium]